MSVGWEDVRYRGDAADVRELHSQYHIDAFLGASEEVLRREETGMRETLMTHGIRLSQRLSPRIYRLFEEVCADMDQPDLVPELYCLPDNAINALAFWDLRGDQVISMVGVTSAALERLDDAELKSFLGHELGHLIFEHNRLTALLVGDDQQPDKTVLPPFGESLFLRWQKKAEISADRAGLLASRDLEASARGLLKAHFGLSERNLNLDIDALLSQLHDIKGAPDLMRENFSSHPLLPIRLRALELFATSDKARRNGLTVEGEAQSDEELESEIDALMDLTARKPNTPLLDAAIRAVAMGGARILAADGTVEAEEVKALIALLQLFVDNPEAYVVVDDRVIRKELPKCLATINQEGSEEDKVFVLRGLAKVALADGWLHDAEAATFMEIAEALQLPPRFAYNVLVDAIRSLGFAQDAKLNDLAGSLRQSLAMGLVGRTRKGWWKAGRSSPNVRPPSDH